MRRTSCLVALALFTTLSAAAAAAGCGASPAITVIHLGPGEKGDAIHGDPVKIRRGSQEAFVGLKGGFYAIRSIEDWRHAWPAGGEPPMPATLDTAHSMLLLGVAEEKETQDLRILKVLETGNAVHVWVRETKVGTKCKGRVERTAFDAVVAPRIDKPLKFYVEQEHAESCGDAPAVTLDCRVNDGAAWTPNVTAQPGDKVECEMNAETRGKFAIVDNVLALGELPGGSAAKLGYTRSSARGAFSIDVFGAYTVRAESTDEAGRKTTSVAKVDALPPKTRDVIVQLVWTNFDVSDDPDTFPRVKLRAVEESRDAKNRVVTNECSLDTPRPDLCEVKTRSAFTHMKLKASDKRIPLDVLYMDERIEKGPLVCIQVYFDGARTGETCDRRHRNPDERWAVGPLDMMTGKIGEPLAGDAGAPTDAGADAAPATKKPATPPAPPKKK